MEESGMKVLVGTTSRDLQNEVNRLKIAKNNIVSIIYRDNQFLLFYYS